LACNKIYTRDDREALHAACTHIDQPIFTSLFDRSKKSEDIEITNDPPKKKMTMIDRLLLRNPVVMWEADAIYTNLIKIYAHATQHIHDEKIDMRYGILFGDEKNQYFRGFACSYTKKNVVTAFVVNLCPSGIQKPVAVSIDKPTDLESGLEPRCHRNNIVMCNT